MRVRGRAPSSPARPVRVATGAPRAKAHRLRRGRGPIPRTEEDALPADESPGDPGGPPALQRDAAPAAGCPRAGGGGRAEPRDALRARGLAGTAEGGTRAPHP